MHAIPILAGFLTAALLPSTAAESPRVVVLTDISSLTPGVAEPDDGQSLIRLMLYTNELEVEGLVASSKLGHGRMPRPDLIRQVVDAYAKVLPRLREHDSRYPSADSLREGIKTGQPVAGLNVKVVESVGEGKETEASRWIIQVVDRPDPRPIWVVIWGGSADLAQALWSVRKTRSPDQLESFIARLRIHSISDQDSTGPWIREQFPTLSAITRRRAYRGMYRGGDSSLASSAWVATHIHGHGPLGDLYPDYKGGDIWSATLGQVRGIKEGDTPSFLSLLPNGLGDFGHPWLGSWGGRFDGPGRHLADIADQDLDTRNDPDPRMSTVYRWRPAFQADFEARLDWCVKPYSQANHPPQVRIAGGRLREAKPGGTLTLDAGGSTDPDGNSLTFDWAVYPAIADQVHKVRIDGNSSKVARIDLARGLSGKLVPILLTVTDSGRPRLSRYGRVLIKVGQTD